MKNDLSEQSVQCVNHQKNVSSLQKRRPSKAEDEKFRHARFSTAPMGISEVESMLPSANVRNDRIDVRELGN